MLIAIRKFGNHNVYRHSLKPYWIPSRTGKELLGTRMRNSTTSTWRLFWRVCLRIHQLENAAVGGCIHPGFRDPARKYLVAFVARVDFYQQGMKSPVCRIFNTEHDRTRRDLVLAQAFFASRSECKLNLLQQSSFSVPFFSKQSFSHIQKRSCTRHSTSSFIRVWP